VLQTSLGLPGVAIVLTNAGNDAIDSLGVRIFVRSKDTVGTHMDSVTLATVPALFPDAVAARYDICQKYDAAGFNQPCDKNWKGIGWGALSGAVMLLKPIPVGAPDAQGVRDWAFDLPLGPMVLKSLESVRFDVLFAARGQYASRFDASMDSVLRLAQPYLPSRTFPLVGQYGWWNVLTTAAPAPSLANSWSFSGQPVAASPDDVDVLARSSRSSNSRIVVYRRAKPVWGTSPDGTAPGLPIPSVSPDLGAPLAYAPIAAPVVQDGVRGPLDSALARPGRVRVNQAGYRSVDVAAGSARIRYYGNAVSFALLSDKGAKVSGGAFQALPLLDGTRLKVCETRRDLSPSGACTWIDSDTLGRSIPRGAVQEGTLPGSLAAGRWRVVVGTDSSAWFQVTDSVYGWVRDASIRYFGIARSGDSSWFHGPSHMHDGLLDGVSGANVGGWYDAGDHLKEPQTMAMALATLATLSATQPGRDADHWGAIHRADQPRDGIPDVLKEARWGAKFFLASWTRNGRQVGADTLGHAGMVTGVGDFGKDHGWWGPPELQDEILVSGRGGLNERTVRRELGTNVLSDVSAALALLSVRWRPYDAAWSDTALAAARDLYAWVRSHPIQNVASPAYSGAPPSSAGPALAATALLWATRDSAYLKDLAYDPTLGSHGQSFLHESSFEGGWLVWSDWNLLKGAVNTDWAHRHALALYALSRLVLLDPEVAASCGVRNDAERILLLRRTVAGMQQNLQSISVGSSKTFDLPALDPKGSSGSVDADTAWNMLWIQQDWVAPGFVAGNAAELLMYADVVRALRDGAGGADLAAVPWPVEAATKLGIRQMDWILGLNHWDVSFVAGVGTKNLQNAHHRAANGDGSNTLLSYSYRTPVGALWGFTPSDTGKATVEWSDYHHAEPTLDGAVQLLSASYLLSPSGSTGPVGVADHRASPLRITARAQSRRIEASLFGAVAGELVRFDVLDVSGRRVAQLEATADTRGRLDVRLPPVARGLAILRIRSSAGQQVRSVPVP